MDTTCAVCRISDGLILNTIVTSPSDVAPDGCQLIEIMTGQPCSIGWYYASGAFHGPKTLAVCQSETAEIVMFFSVSYVSPIPTAPDGCFSVEVLTTDECGIGWTWDGVTFNPPVG